MGHFRCSLLVRAGLPLSPESDQKNIFPDSWNHFRSRSSRLYLSEGRHFGVYQTKPSPPWLTLSEPSFACLLTQSNCNHRSWSGLHGSSQTCRFTTSSFHRSPVRYSPLAIHHSPFILHPHPSPFTLIPFTITLSQCPRNSNGPKSPLESLTASTFVFLRLALALQSLQVMCSFAEAQLWQSRFTSVSSRPGGRLPPSVDGSMPVALANAPN